MNIIILSALLANSLVVQPTDSSDLKVDSIQTQKIKEITVTGTLNGNLTLPVVEVNKNTLDASSFFTAADELQRETGLYIARDAVWATSLNIRGLSEQRILMMVDGDRLQTASDIAAALSTVDLNNIEKIEVIKGAGSVLYGSGAMGGVVNFVSIRPDFSKEFNSTGNIGLNYNTVNSGFGTNAFAQFTNNQWYLSLNGSYRTAQDVQTPAGALPNSNFNDASWGLKAGVKYGDNQEFHVNYQHVGAWDVGIPGGSSFPATATARYVDVERNQMTGEYIISDINPNLRSVNIKAYTQNIKRDVELQPADLTKTLYPGSLNKTSGAKVTSDWEFTDYHKFTIGAEGWMRDAQTYRMTFKTTSDTSFVGTGDQPTPKAQMLDLGVFAHYSWEIIPKKWNLNTGLRLDFINTKNDSSFNPLFQYVVTDGKRKDVEDLSRRLLFASSVHNELAYAVHVDLNYNITKRQKLSLLLANSYRAASIEERFKFIELAGPKHVGDPSLRPEKGTFSNFSYLLNSKRFQLKTDLFANYLVDLITEKSGNYTYLDANGSSVTEQAFVNTNVDKALFLGAELEMKWFLNNQFSLLANASYTNARDIDSKSYLPQIPPLHGFAALYYHLDRKLDASFSALWAATQNEVATSETPTKGYVTFNFDFRTAAINLSKSYLQFYAGIDNILNTAYYNHLSTTRGVNKLEPGRNIYFKAKFGW